MIKRMGFVLLLVGALGACFKKKQFSDVPAIQFIAFQKLTDSAKIVLSFQDGDGDIGLAADQTNAPYDIASKYHYNLYMVYYEKDDIQGWIPGTDLNGDSIVFRNRILPIYTGKAKGLEGNIIATVEPLYYNPFSTQNDTIKYKIQLIDRALHESAWIETPEIYN
jgi:hypothetical protein